MQTEHAHTGTRGLQGNGSNGASLGANSARLGGARADFVAGLGRKVADLRTSLGRVKHAPEEISARDELRRKLQSLDGAAKMMKFDAMHRGIVEALGTLDRGSRDTSLEDMDLCAIEQVIDDLPALAWGDGQARSTRSDVADKASAPRYDVLVVGTAQIAEALLDDETNTTSTFICESTPDAQAAFDLVRATEPDLIVLDSDLAGSTELVEALMDDPLTDAVPMVVVGSFLEQGEAARYVALGVARIVSKPTTREALRAICESTLSPDRGAVAAHTILGEPTLEELGERLANELREALIGQIDASGRATRIPLGQGTEVFGAVWGAIARIREVVTSRSDGAIRFAGGPEGAMTPAPLLLEPDVARSDRTRMQRRGSLAHVKLEDRRIVVADDDPGVVWFIADLLKTAGCMVYEAFDGQQALELAYETSPDLVISDILMPNLDGFSLCRALRRDVALRDTPVILLSWKEDLLQRVRELGAGAAGYVRKESDTRAIIARVREALHSRGRIETRLLEQGEVRGRLDGLSVRTLLEIVTASRPDARVSVRDASFLYELEIRGGVPRRVSRTDGEGGFVKGRKVLGHLLGVSAARFTVTTSTAAVEAELDGNLAAQLAKPIARARAAMKLITGADRPSIARIRFDEEALPDYLKATPERARLVIRRLANGASPQDLINCGGCDATLLDDLLSDVASRGLISSIESASGDDLLPVATQELFQHADIRASFATQLTPPPAQSVASLDAKPTEATSEPMPLPANHLETHCFSDDVSPLCTSPLPGAASSFEDAILHEVMQRSPEPTRAEKATSAGSENPHGSENPELRADADLTASADDGAPPREGVEDQGAAGISEEAIAPLADATVIDDVRYEETESKVSAPEAAPAKNGPADVAGAPEIASDDLTPFASVTTGDATSAPTMDKKRRAWPLVAFVAATGVVAWALLHFTTGAVGSRPERHRTEAPSEATALLPPAATPTPTTATAPGGGAEKADGIFYTPVAAEASLPTGHGLVDVSAPEGSVVLLDGTERARGSAKLRVSVGSHDVRVRRPSADERGCTIDVRTSHVTHVRF